MKPAPKGRPVWRLKTGNSAKTSKDDDDDDEEEAMEEEWNSDEADDDINDEMMIILDEILAHPRPLPPLLLF